MERHMLMARRAIEWPATTTHNLRFAALQFTKKNGSVIDNERDGAGRPFVFAGKIMAAKKNGVTLIELIIVVIIIGVMTFVAVPRMGFSLVNAGKAQTTAQTIAAAIRHTRSLAIANAKDVPQGFSFSMTTDPNGFKIENLKPPTQVVETGSIDPKVSCTGADDFIFKSLGNRFGDTDSLTVSGGGKTYVISVIGATGMVKCEEQ
jgi:prepilin-type N-terminal cleavage/methylation domain-containing protein